MHLFLEHADEVIYLILSLLDNLIVILVLVVERIHLLNIDSHIFDAATEQELFLQDRLHAQLHLTYELDGIILFEGGVLDSDGEGPRDRHLPWLDADAWWLLGIIGISNDASMIVGAESDFDGGD